MVIARAESPTAIILIVEDDATVRGLLREFLFAAGFEVVEAPDGRHGLKLFRQARPDLVLLDIVMPEKDGIETLREIRKLDDSAVVFTMSGGESGADNNQVAALLGAARSFLKPLDLEELRETIREALAA